MAKCGDCFHFQKCSHYVTHEETFPEVGGCSAFRSKGDFVEVVRCKDCKHCFHNPKLLAGLVEGEYVCGVWGRGLPHMKPDDFCSYGEKKDGDGNA